MKPKKLNGGKIDIQQVKILVIMVFLKYNKQLTRSN